MVTRHNRETGDAFLGCTRFPDCKGTRSLGAAAPQLRRKPVRYRLSAGGRPKSVPDYVELIVARRLGRDLTALQGFAVQALVILVIAGGFFWLLTSGTFIRIIDPIIQWYTHTVFSST
jgi:ssDNA-binding Zn-finger/Zn-ribbon topoisomerase 1